MSENISFEAIFKQADFSKESLSKAECKFLYSVAMNGGGRGVIVEIGSFLGRSTIFLGYGSKKKLREKVFAIDPHKGGIILSNIKSTPTFKKFKQNITKSKISNWVIPIKKRSEDAAEKWNKQVRLLFIDGNHSYKEVKKDITLWNKHLVENGIIAFHDVVNPDPGPSEAIFHNLLKHKNYSHFGFVDSIFFCQKRKPQSVMDYLNFYFFSFFIWLIFNLLKSSEKLNWQKGEVLIKQHLIKGYFKKFLTKVSKIPS